MTPKPVEEARDFYSYFMEKLWSLFESIQSENHKLAEILFRLLEFEEEGEIKKALLLHQIEMF